MVGLVLLGAMIFLTVFSFSAVKRINRIVFGVLSLAVDVLLSCITLPALLSNVPNEGLSLVYNRHTRLRVLCNHGRCMLRQHHI